MKIGFISDTHHNLNRIDDAITLAPDMDLWLHAGDNIEDSEYLAAVADVPVEAVAGNTDWSGEADIVVEIPQRRILLTHGDHYFVNRDLSYLADAARELDCNTVVFGHTHKGLTEEINGVLLINPGSTIQPRDGLPPSFMVGDLNVATGELTLERIFLE